MGVPHRREPMRDHERGALTAQSIQRLLNQFFGFIVHSAGGFIEQQDRGIFQQGTGDGEALPLAAAELGATLARHGVQTLLQSPDERVSVGRGEDGPKFLLRSLRLGQQQVFPDARVEQKTLLGDVADVVAQPFFGQLRQWHAIDEDAALVTLVKACQQIQQRTFARARRSDDSDGLAGQGFHGDVADHWGFFRIRKRHPLKPHMPLQALRS